jgi:hypothetical protein
MSYGDSVLEQIEFSIPRENEPGKIKVTEPEGNKIVASLLTSISWYGLSVCAKAVAQKHGFGVEECGFDYPTDLEPGDEVFEGVRLYDAFEDEMFVSEQAFDRFMLRYFDFMTNLAQEQGRKETGESWWGQYLTYVNTILERA